MKQQTQIPESINDPGTVHDLAKTLAARVRGQQKATQNDVQVAVILENKARQMLLHETNQAVKSELTSAIRNAQEVLTINATTQRVQDEDPTEPLALPAESSVQLTGEAPDPFQKDGKANWIEENIFSTFAHYASSIFHLFVMGGGAISTYSTGMLVGYLAAEHAPALDFVWYAAGFVWALGIGWELSFLYSWVMKGSKSIAGDQVGLINRMHMYTLIFLASGGCMQLLKHMMGDAMTGFFITWVVCEVIGAFCLCWMYFKIKGSHPLYKTQEKRTTLDAQKAADLAEEAMHDHELDLEFRQHNRDIKTIDLQLTKVNDMKVLNSRAYRKEKATSSRVRILGTARKKNAKLIGDGTEGKGQGQQQGWNWNPFSRN